MTQQFINAVQYPMVFTGLVTISNQGTGNEAFIDVPPGFVYTSGMLLVTAVFNGTTPALNIVDNMASPNTLLGSTALTALGATPTLVPNTYYPAGGRIKVAITGTGAALGAAAVLIYGVVLGRQNERVGA